MRKTNSDWKRRMMMLIVLLSMVTLTTGATFECRNNPDCQFFCGD